MALRAPKVSCFAVSSPRSRRPKARGRPCSGPRCSSTMFPSRPWWDLSQKRMSPLEAVASRDCRYAAGRKRERWWAAMRRAPVAKAPRFGCANRSKNAIAKSEESIRRSTRIICP
jgi:hypothetical protein